MITELYEIFTAAQKGIQQNIDIGQISMQIQELHTNIEYFGQLFELITSTNTNYQQMAVLGLGSCIKANSETIRQNEEMISNILELTFFPNSDFVRRNVIFYFETSLYDKALNDLIFSFITQKELTQNFHFESAVRLFILISDNLTSENTDIISFGQELNQHAIEHGILDYSLKLAGKLAQLNDESFCISFPNLLNQGFEFVLNLIQQNNQAKAHVTASFISDFIESEMGGYLMNGLESDSETLIQVLVSIFDQSSNVLQNDSINESLKKPVVIVCDSIFQEIDSGNIVNDQFPVIIEKLQQIIASYFLYGTQTFSSMQEDECDLRFDNQFWALKNLAIGSNEVFDIIFNIILQSEETEEQLFSVVSLLAVTFDEFNMFYDEEHFSTAVNLLGKAIQCENDLVRSAAASSVSEFTSAFKQNSLINLSDLITLFLQVMVQVPTRQFLYAFNDMLESLNTTDSIFDSAFETLHSLLMSDEHIELRSQVINCIATLSKHSEENVVMHTESIMEIMASVLGSGDETIIGDAIYCISKLCNVSPKKMIPFIPEIIESIAGCIDPENSACFESIHAFGSMLEIIDPNQISDLSGQVLEKLIQILSSHVDELQQQEQDLGDRLDFNHIQEEEDIEENVVYNPKSLIGGTAARVICQILSIYTDSLIEHFESVYQLLNIERTAAPLPCSKGLDYIVKGFMKIGINETTSQMIIQTMDLIISLASKNSSENTKILIQCFETMSECFVLAQQIIIEPYQEEMLNVLDLALSGSIWFSQEQSDLMDAFYTETFKFFAVLLKNELLRPILIEKYQNLPEFLSDYQKMKPTYSFLSQVFTLLPNEMNEICFSEALKQLETDNYGASLRFAVQYAIATGKEAEVGQLLEFSSTKISESSEIQKNENSEYEINSCLIALSCIQKATRDSFPLSNLPFDEIFSNIPPMFDLASSELVLQFFLYLSTIPDFREALIIPLVKLFSDSPIRLSKRCLSETTFSSLKSLLKSSISGEINCEEHIMQVFGQENQCKAVFLSESLQN